MASIADGLIERALKAAVPRARAESTRARELLAALAGQRVTIVALPTPFAATLESTGTDLRFQSLDAAAPTPTPGADATISGTPLSLLALTAADPQAVIQRGDVRIEGNGEIAQQFRELALLLRPDLESLLSDVVGGSAAHVFMRGVRGVAEWT